MNKIIRKIITYNKILWIIKNMILGKNVNEYSSEPLSQLEIQLKNIPEVPQYSEKSFELRGVCSNDRGLGCLRSSIGLNFALCKRGTYNWEIYDDLQKKTKIRQKNRYSSL